MSSTTAQRNASAAHRRRLAGRGLRRLELRAPEADVPLLRDLARRLAEGGDAAAALRSGVARALDSRSEGAPRSTKGRIFAALRRSPLVGLDLRLAEREETSGRDLPPL